MPTGRVKWFNDSRGFGFIANDDGGPDLYVHYTGVAVGGRKGLHADTRVTFAVRPSGKGPEAYDVRAIGAPPASPPPLRPVPEAERDRPRKRFALPRPARRITGRRS
jgi:CspA family cold shock protein